MSDTASRGTFCTHFAQALATHRSGRVPFDMYADREVTLSENLRHIESRGLRSIWLITRPGYDDAKIVKFSRDDIQALMYACEKALNETADDPTEGSR